MSRVPPFRLELHLFDPGPVLIGTVALACIMLALLVPVTTLLWRDPERWRPGRRPNYCHHLRNCKRNHYE